jgi:hypothetical protein
MFAFILGTSPVFFGVAYLATSLGSHLQAGFMRVVAVLMLVLGLVSVEAGLNLMGSPYSLANLTRNYGASQAAVTEPPAGGPHNTNVAGQAGGPQPTESLFESASDSASQGSALGASGFGAAAAEGAGGSGTGNTLRIMVNSGGYSPSELHARPGQPLQLAMVTKDTYSCARAFVIPSLQVEKILPENGTTLVDVPPQQAGSKLYFSCSMGMYSGVIVFDG